MKQENPPDETRIGTATDATETDRRREALLQYLEYQFRRAGNDATTQALLRAVLEYRLEQRR